MKKLTPKKKPTISNIKSFIGKRVEVTVYNYGCNIRVCDALRSVSSRFLVLSSGTEINISHVLDIKEDPYGYLFKEISKHA